MMSDKCKMQAAITTIVVMAALATHQTLLAKRIRDTEKLKGRMHNIQEPSQ